MYNFLTHQKDTLLPDQYLLTGEYLESENVQYQAELNADGNFQIYDLSNQTLIWQTNTPKQIQSNNLVMALQPSGSLQCFNSSSQQVAWYDEYSMASTSSIEGSPPYHLILTNAGELEMYDAYNQMIWTSKDYPFQNVLHKNREITNRISIQAVENIVKQGKEEVINLMEIKLNKLFDEFEEKMKKKQV